MKKIAFFMIAVSLLSVVTIGCSRSAKQGDIIQVVSLPSSQPSPAPTPSESPIDKEGAMIFNQPETKPETVYIIITKSEKILEMFGSDDELIARFPIHLGENPKGHKGKEGDKKTPEGEYYICTRKDQTENTLFMGLSYPNESDAKAALEADIITQKVYDNIARAIRNQERPTWSSPLGGAIGIHGKYDDREFTQGCIAVTDEAVQIIWDYTQLGTKVTIKP